MVRAEDADLLLTADFTVLSRDIMKIPEAEILETQNEMTVISGEIIYSR